MAPEQHLGHPFGPAVDFWQVGCLIYELYTGCPPFWVEQRPGMTKQRLKALHLTRMFSEHWYSSQIAIDQCAHVLLGRLLQVDPVLRLVDWTEVRKSDFFAGVDWGVLARGEAEPWIRPIEDMEAHDRALQERIRPAQWGYKERRP
jgi:serine/threonine protein kinase